ncbi:MAG: SPOR domain-containing protein [Pseudomonadota bacterium]
MKERLIGAIVLVTVAWLLIPVFLDAPSSQTAGEDTWVTLPRAEEGTTPAVPTRRETIVLQEPERPEPDDEQAVANLPAPSAVVPSTRDETPLPNPDSVPAQVQAAAVDEPERTPPQQPAPSRAASAESAEPQFVAQSAAVADEPPATQSAPPTAPVETARQVTSGAQMWAVQLGSFSNEGNAQRLAAQYRADGLLAFVSRVEQGGRTLHRVRIGPDTDRSVSDAIVARLTAAGQTARTVPHP